MGDDDATAGDVTSAADASKDEETWAGRRGSRALADAPGEARAAVTAGAAAR